MAAKTFNGTGMARTEDTSGRRTKTEAIADEIIDSIVSGRLQPGDRIESERSLTAKFGVSVGTVQKALTNLEHRGIVVREHGRGTFVSRGNKTVDARFIRFNDVDGQALPLYIHPLSVQRMAPDDRHVRFFGRRRRLARIDRLINVGGHFDVFSEFVLSGDAFDKLAKDAPESISRNVREAMAECLMLPTVRVEQEVNFQSWPQRVIAELGPPGAGSGFVMDVRAYTLDDKPLFYLRMFAPNFAGATLVIER
jgi:GntR family transcriptional regulator